MKYIGLIVLLLLAACHKSEEEHTHHVKEVVVDEIPEDIKIPVKLWEKIERLSQTSELMPQGDAQEGEGEKDELLANRGVILFSPVTVVLKESNPQVLESPEIKIVLPRGGGQIDLAQYLGPQPGSFFVKFVWPDDWKEMRTVQSYYVSRGRKRKLDSDVYGVGCNKYLDLTSQLAKHNAGEGIKVNTTRDRHTTVLAGHFIFSGKKDSQVFLSQVSFVDSKNPQLMCETTKAL